MNTKRKMMFLGIIFLGLNSFLFRLDGTDQIIALPDEVLLPIKVIPPINISEKAAKIRPLIWRFQMDETACALQLTDIEAVSLQNYIVDGKMEVTEATACMKSKTFVKFYFVTNCSPQGIVGEYSTRAQEKVEETTEKYVQVPNATPSFQSTRNEKVIKNYPTTTHSQTLEYRLPEKNLIIDIYNSLDKTLLEFTAFPIIETQRSETLRTLKIEPPVKKRKSATPPSDPTPTPPPP